MLVDMNKYKKSRKAKRFNDTYHNKFLPVVCDLMQGEDIHIKMFCAAKLLFDTAAGIFHLNLLGYDDRKMQAEKAEYLKLLFDLAEDVKDV